MRIVLAALVLALAACAEMAPRPEGEAPVPPPEGSGFTPERERVVGFPALFPSQRLGDPEGERVKAREAEREADRVRAMHSRGGTGKGQLVGTVESGANRDHPDLAGKFPHVCALGHCDDGRANRPDHSPLHDTDDHGTQVNGIIAASKNGAGVYGVAYEARIASYGNSATTLHPWGNDCGAGDDCPPGEKAAPVERAVRSGDRARDRLAAIAGGRGHQLQLGQDLRVEPGEGDPVSH